MPMWVAVITCTAHCKRQADLHAADFEAERGLRGRRILQLAALDVGCVAAGVPRAEADLDVADGGAPVVPRHILQRHQLPPARLHHTHCAPGPDSEKGGF